MNETTGSAFDLVERIRRRAPEFLDLFTAETDDAFDTAIDALLEKLVVHLEANRTLYKDLNENALTSIVVLGLNIPGLSASQEKYSNGHVDFTIEANHSIPVRKKLGEAKIYDGPQHYFAGLEQLLGRYSTGREGRGVLLVYFRKANIAGLIQKLRDQMDSELPLKQQGATSDHVIKWSFKSVHAHSCGENLQVGHIGCNLHTE